MAGDGWRGAQRVVEPDQGGRDGPALAAQAIGLGAAADTVERLLPNRTTFEPDPMRHARYAALFDVYLEISRGLFPAFDHLATVAGGGTGS